MVRPCASTFGPGLMRGRAKAITLSGGAQTPVLTCMHAHADMGIDQIQVPSAQCAYGYTGNKGTIKTPNVYQLAQEGLVFQNWYSGFHVCSPSRAAMLTGRLPIRSGVGSPNGVYAPHAPGPSQGNNHVFTGESIGGLPHNESTFAERLRPLGYKSLCIGKW
jgi:arylsulfatase A